MDTVKPLAKSLHTVSVLVNLSRFILEAKPYGTYVPGHKSPESRAIEQACEILELDGKPDVYDLKGQALKQLMKGN